MSVESSYLELDEKRRISVCNIERRLESEQCSQATDDAPDLVKRHVEVRKDTLVANTENDILVGELAAAVDDFMSTICSEGAFP